MLLPREQLVELARGRFGVADVQAHGLADARDIADGERARVGVGAEHAAHEEVAERRAPGRFSSTTRPISSPFSSSSRSVSGSSSTTCCTRSSAGTAGQLDHEVALGGRDHELGADRPRALRDDGRQRQALEHDADDALLGAAAVREQARRAAAAEPREAAQHRHAAEARRSAARPASSEDPRARPRASRPAQPAGRRARGPRTPRRPARGTASRAHPPAASRPAARAPRPSCCSRPAPITPSAAQAPMIAASGARSEIASARSCAASLCSRGAEQRDEIGRPLEAGAARGPRLLQRRRRVVELRERRRARSPGSHRRLVRAVAGDHDAAARDQHEAHAPGVQRAVERDRHEAATHERGVQAARAARTSPACRARP